VGGLATTNNPELQVIMRSLMNHGRDIYISIDDDNVGNKKKLFENRGKKIFFVRLGPQFRCTELEAAMGVAQLENQKCPTSNSAKKTHGFHRRCAIFKIASSFLPRRKTASTSHAFSFGDFEETQNRTGALS